MRLEASNETVVSIDTHSKNLTLIKALDKEVINPYIFKTEKKRRKTSTPPPELFSHTYTHTYVQRWLLLQGLTGPAQVMTRITCERRGPNAELVINFLFLLLLCYFAIPIPTPLI